MNDRFTKLLPLLMLAGLVLGTICGYLLPEFSLAIDFVGRLFVGVLRFIVVPLLIASAVTGLASLTETRGTARTSLVFFSYVLTTTIVAVAIAVGMSLLFAPTYRFTGMSANPLATTWSSVSDALGDIIPANPLRAVAEGKYLGLVLLGALLGAGLAALGVRGRSVISLFRGLYDGLLKVVQLALYAAPLGLFSLVAAAVAQQGWSFADWMATSGTYLGVSLAALAVHGVVILPLIVWYVAGRVPWKFYSDLSAAFLTAFSTGSKAVTFPVTSQCLNDRSNLDIRATSVVLPLGTVLNLNGSAIVMVTGTLFVAQAFGAGLGVGSILALSVLAVILSLGAAGLPSSMLLAAPVLFGAVGLTAEQMALAIPAIAAFDWLVDRVAAVVNVGSDAVAAAVVAGSIEGSITRRPSRARRTSREDVEFERRPRRPQIGRAEGRPAISRPERGQLEPRERGRSEFKPAGKPHPAGDRLRTKSDSGESSPFQMRTGRTLALGSASERPAQETERPETVKDKPERRERRPSREGLGGGRRLQGPPKGRPDRAEDEPRGARRPIESPDVPEAAVESESRRMSREAVAKDLARISAQLGKGAGSESTPDSGATTTDSQGGEPVLKPSEAESVEREIYRDEEPFERKVYRSEEPVMEDADAESLPKSVLWDDAIDTSETSDSRDSDETESDGEPDFDEAEAPTAFGRHRAYRGAAFRRNDAPSVDEPIEPVDEPIEPVDEPIEYVDEPKESGGEPKESVSDDRPQGFSTEDVSFGRAKRKRTRR